jgi:hypothetical protein
MQVNREAAGRLIQVDYYPGAWGPAIRIATKDTTGLLTLKNVFLEATGSEGYRRDLLALPEVHATGIEKLIMTTVPWEEEAPKTLRRLPEKRVAFEWSLSPSSWEHRAELIDGLLAVDFPAHQYLTNEETDDALIEVTYKE